MIKHPKGITALHEASHAVLAALLATPGFESVDIQIRTRETHPGCGIPPGSMSIGYTRITAPEIFTKGSAWKRALGVVAPGIVSDILRYQDDGTASDLTELGVIRNAVGIEPRRFTAEVLRIADELVRDRCVFAAILNTAVALLNQTRLSADEVQTILMSMQAGSSQPAVLLSGELRSLIEDTNVIEKIRS